MPQHSESERIAKALFRCLPHATSWSGIVFRSSSVRYANTDDLLTGLGSKKAGGRWNPSNSFPTVYASSDPETAMAEALAHVRHYRISVASAMPRVFVAIEVRPQYVLDLTRGTMRHTLAVSHRRLVNEPWRKQQQRGEEPLTQAIGRLAFSSGLEGLVAPSAANQDGTNVIVFPSNLLTASWLEIVNRRELP